MAPLGFKWRHLSFSVGVAGFEPTASSSRTKRATGLRYTPMVSGNADAKISFLFEKVKKFSLLDYSFFLSI